MASIPIQFSSVAQSCPTLRDPMNCSMPGLLVHHQLLEFTETHVYRVGDAIQPSHPPSPLSPLALNFSQHQDLSNQSALHIRWPKYWSFSFSISSVQFSCSVRSDSLRHHGVQHTRLPCPSPTPRACSNSYPLSW